MFVTAPSAVQSYPAVVTATIRMSQSSFYGPDPNPILILREVLMKYVSDTLKSHVWPSKFGTSYFSWASWSKHWHFLIQDSKVDPLKAWKFNWENAPAEIDVTRSAREMKNHSVWADIKNSSEQLKSAPVLLTVMLLLQSLVGHRHLFRAHTHTPSFTLACYQVSE